MKICSVLIIDDDEVDRYLLKRLLDKARVNYHFYEAENGKVALDFIQNYEKNLIKVDGLIPPVMIFLDINMPVMGGFEFLERYNSLKDEINFSKDCKSVVVTMFSSSTLEDDIKRAKSFDFVKGYVTKGDLTEEILIERIKSGFPEHNFFLD